MVLPYWSVKLLVVDPLVFDRVMHKLPLVVPLAGKVASVEGKLASDGVITPSFLLNVQDVT
jgi:hypothetical protein